MIDQVLIEFVEKIKATFPQEIVSILFYGSRARADHRQNSDYDILLILKNRDKTTREKISEICVQMLEEREAFLSVIIYSKEEWHKSQDFPFGKNVQREGIQLWKDAA